MGGTRFIVADVLSTATTPMCAGMSFWHSCGQWPVAEALAAGCDAIEQGYGMGEDDLRKMEEKDVLWIPSLLRAKNVLDGAGYSGDLTAYSHPAFAQISYLFLSVRSAPQKDQEECLIWVAYMLLSSQSFHFLSDNNIVMTNLTVIS